MKLNLASPASGSDAIRQDAPVGRTLRPTIPIHDPRFKYTDAANTDIRKRFDAIRRSQRQADIVPIKRNR